MAFSNGEQLKLGALAANFRTSFAEHFRVAKPRNMLEAPCNHHPVLTYRYLHLLACINLQTCPIANSASPPNWQPNQTNLIAARATRRAQLSSSIFPQPAQSKTGAAV